jgi:hypothetical protein
MKHFYSVATFYLLAISLFAVDGGGAIRGSRELATAAQPPYEYTPYTATVTYTGTYTCTREAKARARVVGTGTNTAKGRARALVTLTVNVTVTMSATFTSRNNGRKARYRAWQKARMFADPKARRQACKRARIRAKEVALVRATEKGTESIQRFDTLEALLAPGSVSGGYQYTALEWLANTDKARLPLSTPDEIFLNRYAMYFLYLSTNGSQWNTKNKWGSGQSVCSWEGVDCADGVVSAIAICKSYF